MRCAGWALALLVACAAAAVQANASERPEGPSAGHGVAATRVPRPDHDVRQLAAGFNGRRKATLEVFDSAAALRASWLGWALDNETLASVLGAVDFATEIVVVLSFGAHDTATGKVFLKDVTYDARRKSLSVGGLVGVNEADCNRPGRPSYPFVLGAAPRPPVLPDLPGYAVADFGDGCRAPVASRSVD